MIVSVKNGEFFKIYIDGTLWLDGLVQTIDGRYGLGSVLMLFADDDGDDGTINCSEVAIWDVALTAGEALALGDATTSISGIPDKEIADNQTALEQNYPNPFSNSTTFNYKIQKTGNVTFRILDLVGNEIEVINEGTKSIGSYSLELKSKNLRNGIYFLQMTTNKHTSTRRMVIMR